MRAEDRNRGSIKALMILVLLAANIAASLPHDSGPLSTPGSARAPRAALGAPPSARTSTNLREVAKFSARTPKTAREARALPGMLPL
jgi:hypothetical protein